MKLSDLNWHEPPKPEVSSAQETTKKQEEASALVITPALAIKLGWSIIPTGQNKQPIIASWKPYQTRRPTEEEISEWLELNPATWSIVTGAISKRITLDFNGEKGRETLKKLAIQPHRRTPGGGYHADFVHPGWPVSTVNSKTKRELGEWWPGLDIRADGGYVVFTGRTKRGEYKWLRDASPYPIDLLPTDLREILGLLSPPVTVEPSRALGRTSQTSSNSRVDSERLISMALDHVPCEGRNNAGFWLATQLRDNDYSQAETESVMQNYAARCPSTDTKGYHELYSETEIRATVFEVFRRPARQPWSQEKSQMRQSDQNRSGSGAALNGTPRPNDDTQDATAKPSHTGEPIPKFDLKTGRLIGPIPTIGDTLLYREKFAVNEGEKLYVYREGVYRPEGLLVVRKTGRELMRAWNVARQWRKRLTDEVQEWILLESPELWEEPPLDRINLLNGIYNLSSHRLESHTADWLSPIQLPITYDPSADCPGWDEFLEAVLPPDAYREQVTFQLAALLMIPYTAAQKALLLQGGRGTGKSRFLFGQRSFLGARNCAAKSLHTLEENRFASAYVYGKLANICPDLPGRDLESTSKFKEITGEDVIDAEYKFGKQFQFKPFARLLFSANQPPQSKDTTDAFLDRWWVIPFNQRFEGCPEQIAAKELDRRLRDPRELSGVLNRALRWLPTVIDQHGILQTPSMKAALDEFRAVTDPFRVWLTEFVSEDLEGFEPSGDVMNSYFDFRRKRGLTAISSTAFGLELRKHKPNVELKERTVECLGKLSKPYCYVGIRLNKNRGGKNDS
jgi:P4 family phage/plasmid primase-like protien